MGYQSVEESIRAVKDKMLAMAQMVNRAIGDSVSALMNHDLTLARQVGANDKLLNQARLEIEDVCFEIAHGDAPEATRTALSAVTVTNCLERVGDHAARIAHLVLRISRNGKNGYSIPPEIPHMGEIAQEVIGSAVQAFVARDALAAEATARRDRELHELYETCYLGLAETLAAQNTDKERALSMVWVAHNLDRIADQATNICERAIYLSTGEMKEFH